MSGNYDHSGLTSSIVAEGDKWRLTMRYVCGTHRVEISEIHDAPAMAVLATRWHIENTYRAYLR